MLFYIIFINLKLNYINLYKANPNYLVPISLILFIYNKYKAKNKLINKINLYNPNTNYLILISLIYLLIIKL